MEIVIAGGTHFDGTYPLDDERGLTHFDLHVIKSVAGVRAGEISEALEAGDADLVVAFSVIALYREGKVPREKFREVADALYEADGGSLRLVDGNEGDADPQSAQKTEHASNGDGPESPQSSGLPIGASSENPDDILTHTGSIG